MKIKITAAAFCFTLGLLLFEHFNGGVVTHHLLAREDLPGISNWWGLLTIPLLAWIVVSLINRRDGRLKTEQGTGVKSKKVLRRFLFAFLFGMVVSLLWEFNLEEVLSYLILSPLLLAFFTPVHRPEFLFGFVIGMLYTFGGILPIMVGLVLLVLAFFINKLVRGLKSIILRPGKSKS